LLSAENDNYWPSKKMSNILVENSENKENISKRWNTYLIQPNNIG